MRLAQKVAVVTGAARGIGRAIAYALAEEGARVVLTDMLPEVETTAAELREQGRDAVALTGNVASFEDAGRIIQEALSLYGKIDILVNNAGITRDNLLLRMSEEEWDAVIAVNLKGTFNMTKAAAKAFLKQKSGSIINIASVIGLMGNTGQANYAASKAGVIALTKSVAKEFGSRGIRANAIAPGFIRSKMTEVLPEETKAALLKAIPLGVLGEPEHVAKAVVFLASDDAQYITGQVLQVDGGMVM
ncbi:MAG TPA: 3-oxoacyl-[acyl-carrier-protein] reductase [Bacillota bacterium]|nr:3-oxoacyl-[acyl-carrier-protein] reductase [Bacillota bacterium]HPT67533.1 3-oxoacyl-[acyl-carrier-protein] reductase [Bacillota bacterium]